MGIDDSYKEIQNAHKEGLDVTAPIPDFIEKANIAYKSGDYRLAEDLYRELLDISPNNIEVLLKLSYLYITSGKSDSAIPLLTNAINLEPSNPNSYYNLGYAYQQQKELHLAINYYTAAISLKPDFSLAMNNLGISYQHIGDIKKANKCFKKAIDIDSNCFDAYFNYAQSHSFSRDDDQLVKTLEEKFNLPSMSKQDKIKIHFTLGKAYNDLGNYKFAFENYKQGNSLKNHDFNIKAYSHYIDKIIDTFDDDLVKKLEVKRQKEQKFIFIVGMPRSGSTLIEQIISCHPRAHSAGEVGFIGEIVDDISDLLYAPDSYPSCISSANSSVLEDISNKILSLTKTQCNFAEYIIDKSPVNFLHIGFIKILFPNSIVIHTQRDPIATCLSCYFQNFETQHQYTYDLRTLGQFYTQYHRLMSHWEKLFSNEIIDIKYEELILNQEEKTRELILKCGLEWSDDYLSFYHSKNIISTASKWQTRQPIYKSSVSKHQNYLEFLEDLIQELNMLSE